MTHYALALDVGGTFTDVMLMHRESGQLWTTKTPSTPADPAQGFFQGCKKSCSSWGGASGNASRLARLNRGDQCHSGRQGRQTGMLTTAGFQYVLEIGRHDIPRRANLYAWVKPPRPVPPRRILEVTERVLLDGTIDTPRHCRLP